MLPFLPANVQHVIHVILAAAAAVFVVLKSDPTLGVLPWVVAIGGFLTVLNSIFTSTPGDAKKIAGLQSRVVDLTANRGPS